MRKLNLKKKECLFIGIDPGFSSTGIIGLTEEGEVLFSYVLTMQIKKKQKYRFIEHKGCLIDNGFDKDVPENWVAALSFKNKGPCFDAVSDFRQTIEYYHSFGKVLNSFNGICFEDALRSNECISSIFVAVEIPRMAHQGSGAKIERAFTSVLISLDRLYVQNLFKQCRTVTPGEVKKFITGKANTKKELVLKEVFKRYAFDTDINDVADAYAIARYLRYLEIGEK